MLPMQLDTAMLSLPYFVLGNAVKNIGSLAPSSSACYKLHRPLLTDCAWHTQHNFRVNPLSSIQVYRRIVWQLLGGVGCADCSRTHNYTCHDKAVPQIHRSGRTYQAIRQKQRRSAMTRSLIAWNSLTNWQRQRLFAIFTIKNTWLLVQSQK